jgi:hypothetical protein
MSGRELHNSKKKGTGYSVTNGNKEPMTKQKQK